MDHLTIRKAVPDDLKTIVEYNLALARETEDKTLDEPTLTAGVREMLNNPARGEYFVAEGDGQIVGQTMYTREWSDWRNGDLLWLQSVYVHADYRRQGVFGRLLDELRQIAARDPGVVGLRLYVERENSPAQATYQKHGFRLPGYLVMECLEEL